jgi:hypothetical protein
MLLRRAQRRRRSGLRLRWRSRLPLQLRRHEALLGVRVCWFCLCGDGPTLTLTSF